jgi:hypothetical protein
MFVSRAWCPLRSRATLRGMAAKGREGSRRPKGTGSVSLLADGRADAEYKTKRWDGTVRRLRKRLPNGEAAEKLKAGRAWSDTGYVFATAFFACYGNGSSAGTYCRNTPCLSLAYAWPYRRHQEARRHKRLRVRNTCI